MVGVDTNSIEATLQGGMEEIAGWFDQLPWHLPTAMVILGGVGLLGKLIPGLRMSPGEAGTMMNFFGGGAGLLTTSVLILSLDRVEGELTFAQTFVPAVAAAMAAVGVAAALSPGEGMINLLIEAFGNVTTPSGG